MRIRRIPFLATFFWATTAGFPGASPPASADTISLAASTATPSVIAGGSAQIAGTVSTPNNAGNVSFSLQYQDPNQTATYQTLSFGPNTSATFNNTFNSTGLAPGQYSPQYSLYAPGTTNPNQTAMASVNVLAHAMPYLYVNGVEQALNTNLVEAPSVSPEQAAATGGESFAAAAPAMLGDPNTPTAGLDLDSITSVGSPQITTDLKTFTDLPPDYNPATDTADEDLFHIYLDRTQPGTFSKTFYFTFSDEQDLPGADALGSISGSVTYTFTVTPVPEPSSFALAAVATFLFGTIFIVRKGETARSREKEEPPDHASFLLPIPV
jgi:hypothetical protein